MSTLAIAVGSLVLYLIAYHTYGRWLSRKFFKLDANAPVPSRELNDGRDFVPTRKQILFGHHFTSIAGTGPIVGPALAVIWGWLPALLWVLLGSVFLGAVHDLSALVVSMRNRGQTIGEIAGRLINPRVKILFLLILFLALMIVLAIFGLVIANIFDMYPASVLAVWIAMPVAMGIGWLVYRKGMSPTLPALVSLAIIVGSVVLASEVGFFAPKVQPFEIIGLTISPVITWTIALFVYCYFASVLPVWLLLQPRDFVNSYYLVLGLVLLVVGIGAATFMTDGGVPLVAPAVRADVPGAPPIMPFLFVTIACGAISGFHCLVSSGTSSKQIAKETDAQFVAYGSMLTEGFLAVLVILACCAGLGLGGTTLSPNFSFGRYCPLGEGSASTRGYGAYEDPKGSVINISRADYGNGRLRLLLTNEKRSHIGELLPEQPLKLKNGEITLRNSGDVEGTGPLAWNTRYDSWTAAGGLARTVGAFVEGSANFVTAMGIPRAVAIGLMAVLVASFAATTLDTATRLQRYVIQELAGTFKIAPLATRHGATMLAVLSAAAVAAIPPPGQSWATGMGRGGLTLWPVFGAVNQLLAGLSFMVVAFYLARRRMPTWFIAGAAVVMLLLPLSAMLYQLLNTTDGWWPNGQYHLVAAGVIILALEVWMAAEAARLWPRIQGVLEADLPPIRRGFPVIVDEPALSPGGTP